MQIEPMTWHVDCHRNLEPEHPFGIEVAQSYEESKSSTAVGKLVEHSAEFSRWNVDMIHEHWSAGNQQLGNDITATVLSIFFTADKIKVLLLTLIELPSSMSIECIQQNWDDVTPAWNYVVRRHEVERNYGQNDSRIS